VSLPLRRGEIVRIRDERWVVRRHVRHADASVVDVRGCDRSNRGFRTHFLLPFEPFERVPLTGATRVVTKRRWRHLASSMLADALPSYDALRTVAASRIDILPFQLEPAIAIARGVATRILIADDVGLGKTVQAGLIIAEALERDADAHVLVVVPAALREQWAQELQWRFGLAPTVMDSTTVLRPGIRAAGANPWSAHPVIITSVDYIKRPEVVRALEGLVWDAVVLDEAHGLAGRSDRHAAAVVIGERARTLVMLTATPHSGDEDSFERLCDIGSLDGQFPLLILRRTKQEAGLPSGRKTTWLRVAPTAAEVAMHESLVRYARQVWRQHGHPGAPARLAMIVLARRACSSASSLARSVERRLALLFDGPAAADRDTALQLGLPLDPPDNDDEAPDAELGGRGLSDSDDERRILERILALARRAETEESKLSAIRRLLRRAGEPAIVFTEYRDTLAPLAAALTECRTVQLHGGLTARERNDVIGRFTSGDADVLLATDAAGEGLNLQHRCRLVIDLELPWTPRTLEQRVGRVDRIGQRRRVHQLHLISAGTTEESTVAALLRRRTERARQTLDAVRPPTLQERDVAACVLGDAPLPTDDAAAASLGPRGVVAGDLRVTAIEEAARARAIRTLCHGSPADSFQAFAVSFHRHPAHGCWAVRVEFNDAEEAFLWETLVGVLQQTGRIRVRARSDVRRHVETWGDAVLTVTREQDELLDRLAATIQRHLAVSMSRERAILAEIERRSARLAAALVQPALFDRRVEREIDARRALLHDTTSRCRERLRRLTHRQRITAGELRLAFAALLP
jgi:superfamily II DNA or RNA helicase